MENERADIEKGNQQDGDIPDEVLVVAAILGDLGAFDELVRRYRQAVLRLADMIAGPRAARDVAQDAWLLAFKSLPSIDDPQKFASWLMVITKHRALRYRQSRQTRSSKFMPIDEYLLEQFSALHQADAGAIEEGEAVRLALDQLPEQYSMVMRMKFYDALALKKIAMFLDLPLSTVKWRIHRGKALLQEKLAQLEKADDAWRNR